MRTFLINLDRDTERLAVVKKRLADAGVAFERISAVYGKDLSRAEKDRAVNRLRFRMSMGRGVFDGEIGCALSHAKIYQKMIDENIPVACVLEDDVMAIGDIKRALDGVEMFLSCDKPQVVLLTDHGRMKTLAARDWDLGDITISSVRSAMATEAYVLTLPAAKALLRCILPMKCACDMWGRWVRMGAIGLYGVYPAVANQAWDVFESHIKPKGSAKRTMIVRCLSGLGKLVDGLLLSLGI